MRRVVIGLALMVAIAGVVTGYIYLTTVTDVAIGPGWRLVAAVRSGPISPDPSEFNDGEVITDQDQLQTVWTMLSVSGAPPLLDFASQVVIRVTTIGSGSCPNHLDGLAFEPERIIATATHGFVTACTGDAVPYTFVLLVDRDRLPAVPFTLVVASDSFVREVPITAVD